MGCEIVALGGRRPPLSLIAFKCHGNDLSAAGPPNEFSRDKGIGLAARCMIARACKTIYGCIGRQLTSTYQWVEEALLPSQVELLRIRSLCHCRKLSFAQPMHQLHNDFCSHMFKNSCLEFYTKILKENWNSISMWPRFSNHKYNLSQSKKSYNIQSSDALQIIMFNSSTIREYFTIAPSWHYYVFINRSQLI